MRFLWLGLAIAGPVVLTLVILTVVFAAIRRSIAREAATLEGVVRDSGPIKVTTRFRRFRSARVYRGGGIRVTPAQLVLTATHLHVLERPQLYGRFKREDLARFTVGVLDGRLHLFSKDPPDASGEIDYRFRVDDPETWAGVLADAGAKRAA
ncbi:MAG: hypothetical protein HOW73_32050 [Polyangiaceae bacterium]|nr:hypothetical protein [Polyangiaceae bacterium]